MSTMHTLRVFADLEQRLPLLDELHRIYSDVTVVYTGVPPCPDRHAPADENVTDFRTALFKGGYDIAMLPFQQLPYPLSGGLRVYALLPKMEEYRQQVVVVGRTERDDLQALFSLYDIRQKWGKVTLVGFGPGNPDLLTIAGHKALQQADIIFHDDLLDTEFLHQYRGEKVYVGKRSGHHSHRQEAINQLMYEAAVSGKQVVRLKGGDPMVFAHGREEYDFLVSRLLKADIIPGVSTALALASLTHIPLTARGVARSVAFVLGHGSEVETPSTDTLVYYMGGRNLANIAKRLLAAGRRSDTGVVITADVSLASQRSWYCTLGELSTAVLISDKPVIVMVGEVVAYEYLAHETHMPVTGEQADFRELDKIYFSSVADLHAFCTSCGILPHDVLLLAADTVTYDALLAWRKMESADS